MSIQRNEIEFNAGCMCVCVSIHPVGNETEFNAFMYLSETNLSKDKTQRSLVLKQILLQMLSKHSVTSEGFVQ